MKSGNFGWVITLIVLLGIGLLFFATVKDGNRLLHKDTRADREAVPY